MTASRPIERGAERKAVVDDVAKPVGADAQAFLVQAAAHPARHREVAKERPRVIADAGHGAARRRHSYQ